MQIYLHSYAKILMHLIQTLLEDLILNSIYKNATFLNKQQQKRPTYERHLAPRILDK